MVQIQPTEVALQNSEIPPTGVGGLFRSGLRKQAGRARIKKRSQFISLLGEQVGSEQSTNFPLVVFKDSVRARM